MRGVGLPPLAHTWVPGVHYLQGGRSELQAVVHRVLVEFLRRDRRGVLHLDGGLSASPSRFVRMNKRMGLPAEYGLDRAYYQFALNAHDWHTCMTSRFQELVDLYDPSVVVVTHPIGHLTNHRLVEAKDGRDEAYLRHGIDKAHRIAKARNIPVLVADDFASLSVHHNALVQIAQRGIRSRYRVLREKGESDLFVVPWTTVTMPHELRKQQALDAFFPELVPDVSVILNANVVEVEA